MKKLVLVGALAGVLTAGSAFAQAGGGRSKGRTAPSDEPSTAPSPTVPTGDMALGSIRLPKAVWRMARNWMRALTRCG